MNRKPKKRLARIERQIQKRADDAAKSARLVAQVAEKIPERKPRAGADPRSIYGMQVICTCRDPDVEGAWSWGVQRQWTQGDRDTKIRPKLNEFQTLTWGEIGAFTSDTGHKMHHDTNTEDICKEAQIRLIDIERMEDVIFRFRLGNLPRLWGFRVLNEFNILWYDPTHMVYPVE